MKIRERMESGRCGACKTTQVVFRNPRGGTPVCAACMDEEDLRRTHVLKCWPQYFEAVADGTKTFELRKDDRKYRVGDILHLREWAPADGGRIDPNQGSFTGRDHKVRVTYKLTAVPMAFGLCDGYAILSVMPVYAPDEDEGGACWRLGCQGRVPEGKVGCEKHRLEPDE